MTFLASAIINANLIQLIATVSPIAAAHKEHVEFMQWVHELRTTTIGLARQTGKTTALLNLMVDDTYMLVHNEQMRRYVTTQLLTSPPPELRTRIMTVTGFIQAVTHGRVTHPVGSLFTDELYYKNPPNSSDSRQSLYSALYYLHRAGLLTANFFILNTGTPH